MAIPTHDGRVSPVFDVARHLLVIETLDGEAVGRNELAMQGPEPLGRVRLVAECGVDVLICGAISRPLETMLESTGVTVIARKCGPVEEVLRAFMAGELSEGAFSMPGCQAWRRRKGGRRHGGRPRVNG